MACAAKLLLLESDWRRQPGQVPTERRSAASIYASLSRLQVPGQQALTCLRYPLQRDISTWRMGDFLRLPVNRRGPNLIVLSTHAHLREAGLLLSANGGTVCLDALLAPLRGRLQRSLLVLDTCHGGQLATSLCNDYAMLGVLGFNREVDWMASSIFILSLLRNWYQAGVFSMRRASPVRPARVLAAMEKGAYGGQMRALGVSYRFSAFKAVRHISCSTD